MVHITTYRGGVGHFILVYWDNGNGQNKWPHWMLMVARLNCATFWVSTHLINRVQLTCEAAGVIRFYDLRWSFFEAYPRGQDCVSSSSNQSPVDGGRANVLVLLGLSRPITENIFWHLFWIWNAALLVSNQSATFIQLQLNRNWSSNLWRPNVFKMLHSYLPGCHLD